jgi:hypothetical protein
MQRAVLVRAGILGVLCSTLGLRVAADPIYDNSRNDLRVRFDPGGLEVGDEIIFSGAARYLTNFSFEYWGASTGPTFSGNVEARVRFYQNDGADFNGYQAPGTVLYDSDWFPVISTVRNTLRFEAGSQFPAGGLFLPVVSNMTWTVQFQGLGAGDTAGVDLYSPAIGGANYPDYWENNGENWQLKDNTVTMDFAARMEASPVPEPAPMLLSLAALAVLLAGRGRESRHSKPRA